MEQCSSREANGRSASQEVASLLSTPSGSLLFKKTLYVNLADGRTLYFIKTLFNIILINQTGVLVALQIFILVVLISYPIWDSGYPGKIFVFHLSISRQIPE
jgi:hypothetical protein